MMASSADALETGPVFAMIEGCVDRDFRMWALGIGAGDNDVPLVEVSIAE